MIVKPCIYVVDDDTNLLERLRILIESAGYRCQTFTDAEQFIEAYHNGTPGCLVLDVYLPGVSGEELHADMIRRGIKLPVIFLTAHATIPMAVRTLKAGAFDFLTKPVSDEQLLETIRSVLQRQDQALKRSMDDSGFRLKLDLLTARELQVMELAISGIHNKDIAHQLNISHRTVELHRIKILKKIGAANFVELAQMYERSITGAKNRG